MSRQDDRAEPRKNGMAGVEPSRFNALFRRIAAAAANAVGSKWAFVIAVLLIVLWACSYSLFKQLPDGFNTWQLVINTLTTIITFLMVFLIQNTQNRDAKVMHLKLDELIRGVKGARTRLVNLEEFSDEELEDLQRQFEQLRTRAEKKAHAATRLAEQADETADAAKEIARDASAAAHQAIEAR